MDLKEYRAKDHCSNVMDEWIKEYCSSIEDAEKFRNEMGSLEDNFPDEEWSDEEKEWWDEELDYTAVNFEQIYKYYFRDK